MIPNETVARILDTARVEEVVGDFVSLKRRGANYIACCPFHNEKTPSFYVSPAKGIYKCFGCGKSGTAVGFVIEHENLSYPDALRFLARKYGIEVVEKEESAEDVAARQKNESLLLVSDFAQQHFAANLNTQEGRSLGYAYFKSRGLEDETIRKYGLGWSQQNRTSLIDEARSKGYKDEYLVETGLAIRYDDGRLVDRFFERAMFPIHSVSGRVIAFGGRTLRSDKTVAKYVNSPETDIYDKSRSLYGIYFAKNEISRQDKCYLVEGYLDVLSMHQLGITNVVASSGTSLTVPQIRLIHKFTENVTIMYDGDSAGIHAALRGIGLILKEGMNVKIVLLPDGDDPDSYSRKHTLDEVREFIDTHEQDFIGFKTDLLLGEIGGDPLKKADLINDIADTIALIPDPVKRTVYAQTSAEKFDISQDVLFSRVNKSHDKMLADDRKRAEIGRAGSLAQDIAGHQAIPDAPVQNQEKPEPDVRQSVFENPFLEPSEKELLWFILNSGLSNLDFESDSEFYDEESPCTVADFIRLALEGDGQEFVNGLYRKAYDMYFSLYDANAALGQDDIVKAMMDGGDRSVADAVADLTHERHQITVKNYLASMTAEATKLVANVPRSILVYKSKRLEDERTSLQKELTGCADDDRAMEIMSRMQKISTLIRSITEDKLNRK